MDSKPTYERSNRSRGANTNKEYNMLTEIMYNGFRIQINDSGALLQKETIKLPPTFLDQQEGNILFLLFSPTPKIRVKTEIKENIVRAGDMLIMTSKTFADLKRSV